jgi:20S proteasome subunit alpha 5
LAGCDDQGSHLYFSDPSGTYSLVKAHAIGSGSEGALNNLKESYTEEMTLQEAQKLAISTLKQHMEEKLTNTNVELAIVTPSKGFHIADVAELDAIITSL